MANKTPISGQSFDIQAEKLDVLKKSFPEIFTEGKIDCLKLKQTLGESVSTDSERYGLSWAGKGNCFNDIQTPTMATLVPDRDESVDFDKTKNLFIEGENLEVLKVLQKSYHGKVKMVYIDPPYNTGTDSFVYPDDFSESEQEYLKKAGDVAETGEMLRDFHKNSKDGGRYHSNWLNMIYPRLFLARNLLREDGVIFVSIDDNEVHNLRMVMNEVFGEENFVSEIVWFSKYTVANDTKFLSKQHEYILTFAKNKENLDDLRLPRTEEMDERYTNPDDDSRGPWKPTPLHAKSGNGESYVFVFKNDVKWKAPQGRYPRFSQDTLRRLDTDNRIWFGKNNTTTPSVKTFLSELGNARVVGDLWHFNDVGHTHSSNEELSDLLGKGMFDNPKPTDLIKRMVQMVCKEDDVILDFFAGSGTTADAIMQLNAAYDGDKRYILVQIPEETDVKSEAYKAGYKNIADISKERIRRAGNNIKKDLETKKIPDIGFKVLKLEQSNFKIWRASSQDNATTLQAKLESVLENVKSKANKESILLELLLKSGIEPTVEVEDKKDFYLVKEHQLVICLADKITEKIVADIVVEKPKTVLCLDISFAGNDQLKTNTSLQLKSEGVEFKVV